MVSTNRLRDLGWLVLAVFGAAVAQAPAATVVLEQGVNGYSGTRDTTIYEEGSLSNGGGEHVFAGDTNTGNARRALVAFDLSSIPTGASVTGATLELTVSRLGPVTFTTSHSLHRLTSDWGEGSADALGEEGGGATAATGDATWTSRFLGSSTWTTAGGDYVGAATATTSVSNSAVGNKCTWTGTQLAQDVQAFVDGSLQNFGWIVIGNEASNQTAIRYFASESLSAPTGSRPQLVVDYVEPPSGVKDWILY